MDKVKIIDHLVASNLSVVKTAALYFNKIELFQQRVTNFYDSSPPVYTPTDFNAHVQPLIVEGIAEYVSDPRFDNIRNEQESVWEFSDNKVAMFVNKNADTLFKKGTYHKIMDYGNAHEHDNQRFEPTGKLKSEVKEVLKVFNDDSESRYKAFAFLYFVPLFTALLKSLNDGEPSLTSSTILNELLKKFFKSEPYLNSRTAIYNQLNVSPKIVHDTISLALPKIEQMTMEEILETRYRLRDELLAFRSYMTEVHLNLTGLDQIDFAINSKTIVDGKIRPALTDLKEKMKGLTGTISTTLLKELRDPKSYSPLALTLTENISNTFAILISLGLISVTSAMEMIAKRKEIKSNGLYYLLKLDSR